MSEQNVQVTQALEPCPFCGGVADVTSYDSCDCCGKAYNGRVSCSSCRVEQSHYDTDAEAIAAWNHRTRETCKVCGNPNRSHHTHIAPFGENYHPFEATSAMETARHRIRAEPDLVEVIKAAKDLLKHFDERGFHLPSVMLGERPRTQVERVERLRAAVTRAENKG